MKYREVLFLQDVKNLSTAETVWVLNFTGLLRARLRVRNALASRLLPKLSQKKYDLANSYTHEIPCDFEIPTLQNPFCPA